MLRVDRLLLRKRQYPALTEALYSLRLLYNAALEQRILAWRRQRKTLSFFDQSKDLTELRASDDRFAALSVEMVRLTVLKRLHLAFRAFFRRLRAGERPGFPRFKGKGRLGTLAFGVSGWRLRGRRLWLQGIGVFSVVGRLHLKGRIKGLRLIQRADRWEVQIIIDIGPAPIVRPSMHSVGIDVGVRTFAALSDGNHIEYPRFLREASDRLKTAQRCVAAGQRGSKRRAKARIILARLHRQVANRRQNFLHQTTVRLVRAYDGFAVEKLDIQEMVQRIPCGMTSQQARRLHHGIMDSAWSIFSFQLGYKAEGAGKPKVEVDPKGTSLRCSRCGSLVRKTLRDRVHICFACGLVLDRDENAAVNIHDLGQRSAGFVCGGSIGSVPTPHGEVHLSSLLRMSS